MIQGVTVCDGTGQQDWCTTKTPHTHCVCGLPMKLKSRYCELCEHEQLVHTVVEMDVWDGRTYPSLRLRRTKAPIPDPYRWLVDAINGNYHPYAQGFWEREPYSG